MSSQFDNSTNDLSNIDLPEAVNVHLFHNPSDENDVNGLNFIIKKGKQKVTVALREGEINDGNELPAGNPYETGGEKYNSLLVGRHEHLSFIQNKISELSNEIFTLFIDIKS